MMATKIVCIFSPGIFLKYSEVDAVNELALKNIIFASIITIWSNSFMSWQQVVQNESFGHMM